MSMPTISSTLVKRSIAAACALLSIPMFCVPAVYAIPIQHLVIPAAPSPTSGTIFALPGFGNVRVTHNYSLPTDFIRGHQTGAENKSAGSLSCGTDTDRFNIVNTHTTTQDYTITFDFLSGQPDVSRLFLIVVGLAANTTATVSQPSEPRG